MEDYIKYDNKYACRECGGVNEIKIIDSVSGRGLISECETKCISCSHNDY